MFPRVSLYEPYSEVSENTVKRHKTETFKVHQMLKNTEKRLYALGLVSASRPAVVFCRYREPRLPVGIRFRRQLEILLA